MHLMTNQIFSGFLTKSRCARNSIKWSNEVVGRDQVIDRCNETWF